MGIFSTLRNFFTHRGLRRRYRYPALAEAEKALFTVEQEIVDPAEISDLMEKYKEAQGTAEKERDAAYIPIYLALEKYIIAHQPPFVKRPLTREQIRQLVSQAVTVEQMNPPFRLIFSPENEQVDHFLKIGALELLRFLFDSMGQLQLSALLNQALGATPFRTVTVTEDGISFAEVHKKLAGAKPKAVFEAYQHLYALLYKEIANLFGEPTAQAIIAKAVEKITRLYGDSEFTGLFLRVLPELPAAESSSPDLKK